MSKGAVYKQGDIVAELERRLDAGIYTSGFPVGADLAAEFGVNIKTINKAINQLVEAGRWPASAASAPSCCRAVRENTR